jgi:hypothetical protein
MEDVLDVYTRPEDLARPPLPSQPGRPARADAEYVRARLAILFLFLLSEPWHGWRAARVSDQRTRLD